MHQNTDLEYGWQCPHCGRRMPYSAVLCMCGRYPNTDTTTVGLPRIEDVFNSIRVTEMTFNDGYMQVLYSCLCGDGCFILQSREYYGWTHAPLGLGGIEALLASLATALVENRYGDKPLIDNTVLTDNDFKVDGISIGKDGVKIAWAHHPIDDNGTGLLSIYIDENGMPTFDQLGEDRSGIYSTYPVIREILMSVIKYLDVWRGCYGKIR